MDDTEGGDVSSHAAVALGHREVSNADELVDAGATTEKDLVSNTNVSGDHDIVGQDVVVSNGYIVGQMRDGHEKIAVANDGVAACFRTAIDSDVFAEGVLVANEDSGFGGWGKGKVLGISTDDHAVVEDVIFPHRDAATDLRMGGNLAAGPNDDIIFDD